MTVVEDGEGKWSSTHWKVLERLYYVSHMELRDDKVVFFLPQITQGKLKMTYRLRADSAGTQITSLRSAVTKDAPPILQIDEHVLSTSATTDPMPK